MGIFYRLLSEILDTMEMSLIREGNPETGSLGDLRVNTFLETCLREDAGLPFPDKTSIVEKNVFNNFTDCCLERPDA